MVSFHTPLSPSRRRIAPRLIAPRLENLFKKRKFGEDHDVDDKQADQNTESMMMTMKSQKLDTELHLENRFPQEWQRCLDIKSGQIYFYNTRTKQRMLNDPISSPEPPQPPNNGHMSLDLELNLPCGSSSSAAAIAKNQVVRGNMISNSSSDDHHRQEVIINSTAFATKNNTTTGLSRAPSWLTFEEGEQEEMVAAACRKCHMLVMMCKSSPSCPNCKFLHPPELSSAPGLLKRRLSLFC